MHRSVTMVPRSRDESEEVIIRRPQRVVEEIPISTQSVAKSFHTTISEDRTDQVALDAHRLVALQQKSELNHPLNSVSDAGEDRYREIV